MAACAISSTANLRWCAPRSRGARCCCGPRRDWSGGRKILPGTREIDLLTDPIGVPLRRTFHYAYEYSDCFADDARLVVLSAVDAAERGAVIRTRTRCVRAERGEEWRLILNARGQRDVITARILVNAAGASVESFAETALRQKPQHRLR